jgi:transcriptional regulator with XRE-family HTH domain
MSEITFGKLLESGRTRLSLTCDQLACLLGVSAGHISNIEHDHGRPSLALLNRIVEVLGLPRKQAFSLAYPEAMAILESHRMHEGLSVWQKFTGAKGLLARYDVTPHELKVLASIQLLGKVTAPSDFLFILNSIRQAIEAEAAA